MRLKVRANGEPHETQIFIVRDDGSEEEITGAGVCSVAFVQADGQALPVVTLGFELCDFEGIGLGATAEKDLAAALRVIGQMGPLPTDAAPSFVEGVEELERNAERYLREQRHATHITMVGQPTCPASVPGWPVSWQFGDDVAITWNGQTYVGHCAATRDGRITRAEFPEGHLVVTFLDSVPVVAATEPAGN